MKAHIVMYVNQRKAQKFQNNNETNNKKHNVLNKRGNCRSRRKLLTHWHSYSEPGNKRRSKASQH